MSKKIISADKVLLVILMFALLVLGDSLDFRVYIIYAASFLIVLLYGAMIIRNGWRMCIPREILCILAFYIYSVLSMLWARDVSYCVNIFRVLTVDIVMVIFLTDRFHKKNDYEDFLRLFMITGCILALIVLFYIFRKGLINIISNGRVGRGSNKVLGYDSNAMAYVCAVTGLIAFYFALFRGKKKLLFLLIPLGVVVVATTSRKGILVLLLGCIALMYFYSRVQGTSATSSALKIGFAAVIMLLVLILIMQLPMFDNVRERYLGLVNAFLGNSNETDISTTTRLKMLQIGWKQFLKTPLFGIGLNNSLLINITLAGNQAYMHSNIMELLVDGGVVGFVLYYSLYVSLLIKHIRRLPEKNPLVYFSFTLLLLRIVWDVGAVSYYGYTNIIYFTLWIAIANGFDKMDDAQSIVLAM